MSTNENNHAPSRGEFLLFRSDGGDTHIQALLQGENVWLTINELAKLFQIDKSGISRHLKNIFETHELQMDATVAKFATVQKEGDRMISRQLEYYSLDVIISVGYRVNSHRGTQFRQWATERLREYIVKGFTMDDERLKQAGNLHYFDELLDRIRDIRSSEKVFWRKVLDIYATSIDYSPKTEASLEFFRIVQNKMHWAAHRQTAAEVIYSRADAMKPRMGLTSWSGAAPRKADVSIAKNYLNAEELDILNRIVTLCLDFAELQARNRKPMYMKDWVAKLDSFLRVNDRETLNHSGKISHELALQKAHEEYAKYQQVAINTPSPVETHYLDTLRSLEKLTPRDTSN